MPAMENAKKQPERLQAKDLVVHGVFGNFQSLIRVGFALDQNPREVPCHLAEIDGRQLVLLGAALAVGGNDRSAVRC